MRTITDAKIAALMEERLNAMEARFTSLLEQHRSATEEQISRIISKRKRKRISSSIPSGCEFENLPREIVGEILSRLPTESLMRFKCLNKSWYFVLRSLFNDLGFVAKQHQWAEAHPTFLLIDERELPRCNWSLSMKLITDFIETTEDEDMRCVTKDIDLSGLPRSHVRSSRNTHVKVYHCNGIVCLTKDFQDLTLYNPMMQNFSTFRPKTSGGVGKKSEILLSGFGSDSGATSFKFVRITRLMKAQVYEPGNSDNLWREIEFSFNVRIDDNTTELKHLYWRGRCFWLVPDSFYCLCFDVANEVFQASPLPKELRKMKEFRSYIHLVPREGSLCLFYDHPGVPVEVWIMDIDNKSSSWMKWISFKYIGFSAPLAFRKNDELLFDSDCQEVSSYNIHTKNCNILPQIEILCRLHYFGPYVNSLASLKWMIQHPRL